MKNNIYKKLHAVNKIFNTWLDIMYKKLDIKIQEWGATNQKALRFCALFVVLLTPIMFAEKYIDTDTWFLVNSGKYIINNGFALTEPFSMHSGMVFSFQQWFTDVYFYILFLLGGRQLLIAVIMLESIIMLLLFYNLCMTVSKHNRGVSLVCTLLFSATISVFMVTRPQITTYIVLIAELLALEKFVKSNDKRKLMILPILSIIEINLHAATWVMLFIFMLPYLCEVRFIKGKRVKPDVYSKKPLLICMLVMIGCGLVNPYGIINMMYTFNSNGSKYIHLINEMQATTYNSYSALIIAVFTLIILVKIIRTQENIKLRYVYLYLGTLFMAMVATRNCAFFFIGALLIIAYLYRKSNITHFDILHCIRFIELIAVTFALAIRLTPSQYNMEYENQNCEIIKYLNEICIPEETNLYTEYNTGAIYEYSGYRCSIDARMEVYTSKMNKQFNYYDEAVEAESGIIYYKQYFEKYKFDYYVISKSNALYVNVSNDESFEKLCETDDYALFTNNNSE